MSRECFPRLSFLTLGERSRLSEVTHAICLLQGQKKKKKQESFMQT